MLSRLPLSPLLELQEVLSLLGELFWLDDQVFDEAPRDELGDIVGRLELVGEELHALAGKHLGGAGECINSGIFELRPSVDRHVGFADDNDPTDPVRLEMVELGADDCGVDHLGALKEIGLNVLGTVQTVHTTVKQLDDVMLSQEQVFFHFPLLLQLYGVN